MTKAASTAAGVVEVRTRPPLTQPGGVAEGAQAQRNVEAPTSQGTVACRCTANNCGSFELDLADRPHLRLAILARAEFFVTHARA